MSKFKFRLESVKRLRDLAKDLSARELGVCEKKLKNEEELKRNLIDAFDSSSNVKNSASMADLALESMFRERLSDLLQNQEDQIKQAKIAVENALEEFLERSKESKVMSHLKERRSEEFKENQKRENRKKDDQIQSIRFSRDSLKPKR